MARLACCCADRSWRVIHLLRIMPSRILRDAWVADRRVCSRTSDGPSAAKAAPSAVLDGTAEAVPLPFVELSGVPIAPADVSEETFTSSKSGGKLGTPL